MKSNDDDVAEYFLKKVDFNPALQVLKFSYIVQEHTENNF